MTTLGTVFHLTPSRSGAIARQLFGEHCAAVVATDRARADHWRDPTQRPLCWSHWRRDFHKILERGAESDPSGCPLKLQAESWLGVWARVRDGTLPHAAFLAEFPASQGHLRYGLVHGLFCPCDSPAEPCRRLIALDAARWSFVTAPGVEPTNTAAERALRQPVLWRRTSQGTHAEHGRLLVQPMLPVAQRWRQPRRPVFALVRSARLA